MALLNEKNAFKFLDGLFLIIFVSTYLFPIVHLQRIIFMKKNSFLHENNSPKSHDSMCNYGKIK